jgi:hypothetical protein
MRRQTAVIAGAFLIVAAETVAGQSFQGGLRGSIKDAGGVVPGVELTITNEATNISRSVTSNERGEYAFAAVEPGTYKLTAAVQGFKTYESRGIRIGTQTFIVLDVTLDVGAIEENVTVSGQSPVIETANASQGAVLDGRILQTLPAAGRAAFLVGTSIPTVIPSGDAQFNRQQDQSNASLLSLGGGTRRGNNYTLDGVSITDITNRVVANPSIEALEDVKVQVHTYDAEMGRTGGGVFNTTLKSGTNTMHGTAFFQTRPVWGQANNYFSEKAHQPKPDSVYYMPGGGIGGPIKKNKTFFWFASENYHDISTRNVSTTFPTLAERNGDFSGLVNSSGQKVTIYDPLTHQAFPGNIIPANRINAVAAAIAKYLPLPDLNVDNGSTNYTRTAQIDDRFQQEYAVKIEHKLSDRVSLTGFYLYNRTNEPCSDYFTPGLKGSTRFADPNDYLLQRRPQIVALNNTWIPGDNSVLALRFGWTRFVDNSTMTTGFDPSTLGFSQTFLNEVAQTGVPKFPNGTIAGYSSFGAITPSYRTYKSWSANGSYSRFVGDHTFKMGADFRRIGVSLLDPSAGSGSFQFDREFTSATGNNNSSLTDGNAFASFLLGYPSGDPSRVSTMPLTTPLELYTSYFGGYWQDDWRVGSKFTLNFGLRAEHEGGIREVNNNFTVGFNPAATNALSSVTIPADPVAGTPARQVLGSLMFAGVGGNRDYQGNPPAVKWSPRVGVVHSISPSTVLRSGFGLYWAPWNYPVPSTSSSNYGQIGYTQNTPSPQTTFTPTVTLDNPFPFGLVQPSGNSRGALSGVGQTISFVDQKRTAPRVQQYSADVQHELPGGMAITVSYIGARGDHLPLGGTVDTPVNINQLDPKYLTLGTALNQQVPNPFFGNPNVPASLSTPTTLPRSTFLRPYPQFQAVNARQVSEGLSRYNAGVVEWTRRLTHGFGGRVSYTYSVLKDNQIGETNFFTSSGSGLPLNNYNYIVGSPYYNPMADYGYGFLDVPHRVVIAPIVELPFGKGKPWANGGSLADYLIGGWSAAAIVTLQSGFPIGVSQSDNTGLLGGAQRPNLASGTDLATAGGYQDRLASADHPTATWINQAGFSKALDYTFGNAPRSITDLRKPTQKNVDVSLAKNVRLGGAKTAQVKIEVFNLLNRVTVRGISSTFGTSSFGQITTQSGFMRMTQVMFRLQF